ncbi:MAG: hypothetical protein WBC44_01850 [Planctomycetaceae bacterium]
MSLRKPHRPAPFPPPPQGVTVPDVVPEGALDYKEIFRRGGANCGDEDFALCKCPRCGRVYLLEYEVDTIYLDAEDLARRASVTAYPPDFRCVECSGQFPNNGAWIGTKAPPQMQVRWQDLVKSPWRWVTIRTREPGL